jgi:hypothetical protein
MPTCHVHSYADATLEEIVEIQQEQNIYVPYLDALSITPGASQVCESARIRMNADGQTIPLCRMETLLGADPLANRETSSPSRYSKRHPRPPALPSPLTLSSHTIKANESKAQSISGLFKYS